MNNKRKWIFIITGMLVLIIGVFIVFNYFENNKKVLICINPKEDINGNFYSEYHFIGHDNIAKTLERYAKINDNERHEVINAYYEILRNDKTVYNIKINGDTIEWNEKQDLSKDRIFNNCRDENGNILFSKCKKDLEDDGYTCNY